MFSKISGCNDNPAIYCPTFQILSRITQDKVWQKGINYDSMSFSGAVELHLWTDRKKPQIGIRGYIIEAADLLMRKYVQ